MGIERTDPVCRSCSWAETTLGTSRELADAGSSIDGAAGALTVESLCTFAQCRAGIESHEQANSANYSRMQPGEVHFLWDFFCFP
jgi:hypothetical protein